MSQVSVGRREIEEAHARIAPHIHRTPVLTSSTLDRRFGGSCFFKCENFQKTGAFKIRGAFNAVMSLTPDEAARGIVTSSSGNHAAAVSLAARTRGMQAHIAMPKAAVPSKVAAVRRYGGNIVWVDGKGELPTAEEFDETAAEVQERLGASSVHPYDDLRTIAGQGTCTIELLADVADLDLVLAPVGGGGLLSGTCIAAATADPVVAVVGCEPECADDAQQSLRQGTIVPQTDPRTCADGLRTSLGEHNFAIIAEHVADIVTVSEAGILAAMRLVWETMKIVIEPSAAVPVAALLERRIELGGRRAGLILSGGNVDLESLPPWSEIDMAAFEGTRPEAAG
ncbi:MAG TPA: pyridoxal-phosphate dependent enzyme [Acidobacteriota bacterium]|nr:pyridoxal-phosphate dependent enzyme [Acidobacteriota bacterium]